MLEAYAGRNLLQFFYRNAAAVGRSNERAHARASYETNRNIFRFEYFENADVRDAAGETAAQRDPKMRRSLPRLAVGGLPRKAAPEGLYGANDFAKTLHRNPKSSPATCPN